jgi:hypothetical protein
MKKKRFKEKSVGNKYVYEINEMLRKMKEKIWKELIEERKEEKMVINKKVVDSVEIVMEGDDKIVEKKSLKGEKNVGMIEWSFKM